MEKHKVQPRKPIGGAATFFLGVSRPEFGSSRPKGKKQRTWRLQLLIHLFIQRKHTAYHTSTLTVQLAKAGEATLRRCFTKARCPKKTATRINAAHVQQAQKKGSTRPREKEARCWLDREARTASPTGVCLERMGGAHGSTQQQGETGSNVQQQHSR
ncbi:hypothetical protein LR48_Vigan04g119700 [Vigna angularis]|uniref:Uncharacterized protein n=1 Tax=Phaseolus angularis TaxID=3914 RepID=A0A0L9UEP1_PHAAN|nr:hypothetical protein LR48_Vigan04g119700 [Vigna angularis]